ncbi:hypothetical protein SKAU_G00255990 [Synaphobranchus kaupii]|uniref:Uncharacterized protein n=1 Tax=Synaphobranchus kaupii TaxID=118154 RepID=A0A9Q1F3X2_SYNKA|nr:hypothetical protein SKAU_G00255990 [Synaphobranchus kaupii]
MCLLEGTFCRFSHPEAQPPKLGKLSLQSLQAFGNQQNVQHHSPSSERQLGGTDLTAALLTPLMSHHQRVWDTLLPPPPLAAVLSHHSAGQDCTARQGQQCCSPPLWHSNIIDSESVQCVKCSENATFLKWAEEQCGDL